MVGVGVAGATLVDGGVSRSGGGGGGRSIFWRESTSHSTSSSPPFHTTDAASSIHLDPTCIRQHTSAYVCMRQHTPSYVSIRQHCGLLDPTLSPKRALSSGKAGTSARAQEDAAPPAVSARTGAAAAADARSCLARKYPCATPPVAPPALDPPASSGVACVRVSAAVAAAGSASIFVLLYW